MGGAALPRCSGELTDRTGVRHGPGVCFLVSGANIWTGREGTGKRWWGRAISGGRNVLGEDGVGHIESERTFERVEGVGEREDRGRGCKGGALRAN